MTRVFRTPFLWLGQLVCGIPRPWKYFDVDGVMVNAYDILVKKRVCEKIESVGIHRFMSFDGFIMMDSGGFLFMKSRSLKVHPKDILNLYEHSSPDFGVVLDHPLSPQLSYSAIKRRQMRTLENTAYMLRNAKTSNPKLVPVIHGYSSGSAGWFIRKLGKIGDFFIYGVGSLVPSVFSQRGAKRLYNVIKVISYIRRRLSDKLIHVFGVGSTLTMHLMFYLGVDSVDSSGWRKKAAYGAIQLPGVGDRYITPKRRSKNYPGLSSSEKRLLDECECPVCRKHSIEELISSFKLRALHNAWVHQREVEYARKLISEGEYDNYVEEIFKKTIFYPFFEFAKKIKRRYKLSARLNAVKLQQH